MEIPCVPLSLCVLLKTASILSRPHVVQFAGQVDRLHSLNNYGAKNLGESCHNHVLRGDTPSSKFGQIEQQEADTQCIY